MSCTQKRCVFESLVLDSFGCMIAIDKQYNVIVVNNAMKRNAKQIIGKDIAEGMNLSEVLHDNLNFLSVWSDVFQTGQHCKKLFSNTLEGTIYKASCYPIHVEEEVVGCYGFIKESMKGDTLPPLEMLVNPKKVPNTQCTFETLTDKLPHHIWLTTANGDGYWTNKRWNDYTGLTLEECKCLGWTVALHPDDKKQVIENWCDSLQHHKNFEVRYRIRRHDGVYRWHVGRAESILSADAVEWWLGTCTDIEDYVQVESKLSHATAQLNLLMAAAHFGVWSWDLTTNDFHVDDNVKEMFHLDNNTLNSTQELLNSILPEDAEKVSVELKKAIEVQEGIYDAEFRMKDGGVLAGRGKVFRDVGGNPTQMIGINWDITQRKRLEQEKVKALECAEEEARKRIQEAQEHHKRLEEFVDTICHEIRNPLNGITGIISLMHNIVRTLQTGCPQFNDNVKQITDCLGTLQQCADQQQLIVDDVLDLSKVEKDMIELNPTTFSLENLIETIQGVFMGGLRVKKLQYYVHYEVGVEGSYKADSHRLSQILMNLISNAIKFTEAGGITVDISKQPLSEKQCLLFFSVSDTGIGMTPEELTKLFNKFSQANPSISPRFGGSGLGLIISKKLAERMGGSFQVDSEKGVGTRFRFSVVCEEVGQQKAEKVEPVPSEEYNLSSKRVLIVEDNVINQKILTCYMQQQDCICQVANNGAEAVDMCEESKFDIILMDLEMPIMGGLEATRKLREKSTLNQNTTIVGLSGNARKEHKDEAIRCGMNAYLTKPYHKSDIYKTIAQMSKSENALKRKTTD